MSPMRSYVTDRSRLKPTCSAIALQQRLDLALGLRVGGHRLVVLLPRGEHVAQHGVAAIARQACSVLPLPALPSSIWRRNAALRRGEVARAQMEDARQHLRLGILGRQIGRPGVGGKRIGDAVEQRQRTELAPVAHLAAVELAVGRAVPVHAPAQELLGLRPMPARLHQHGTGGRLDVPLEGLAGAHGRGRVDAVGEQGCRLRQAAGAARPSGPSASSRTRSRPCTRATLRRRRRTSTAIASTITTPAPAIAARPAGLRSREPGRHRPIRLDRTLLEPPELHAPPNLRPTRPRYGLTPAAG